jgi:hypothetical protein
MHVPNAEKLLFFILINVLTSEHVNVVDVHGKWGRADER